MVVLIVYHDLDNDVHDHLIVPLVENIHRNKDQLVEATVDTLVFHDENKPTVVIMVVNMVNET
jgi:hypothetical protein